MIYIQTPVLSSKFAKTIQEGLRALTNEKVLRTKRSKPRSFVVQYPSLNKIEQLQLFKEHNVSCPPFTRYSGQLQSLGSRIIFARTLVNSTNGRGIVEIDIDEQRDFPDAPLYVAYIPKKSEYRVHVLNGEAIDIQQKKKKCGFESDRNTRIRNVSNGYVYCRDDIAPPDGLANLAVSAVEALGYKYGAVDIVYNEKRNQLFVLEVNTRPGLTGTTLQKYCQAIIKGL